jgi:predicted dinucleotide-binding enzyme
MKIAIIGAGSVGTSLASGWIKSGHQIAFGVREPNGAKAKKVRDLFPQSTVKSNNGATLDSDVIVFSTPWEKTEEAVRMCADLTGKIVIDATNPLRTDFTGLDRGFNTSGAEQVAEWAVGAQVFKAMNQIGSSLMDHPSFVGDSRPVMFVAGDGPGKSIVLQLVGDLGFEAIDVGPLKYSRLLEPYALLWIHLALVQGLGRDFAFGLLRKK